MRNQQRNRPSKQTVGNARRSVNQIRSMHTQIMAELQAFQGHFNINQATPAAQLVDMFRENFKKEYREWALSLLERAMANRELVSDLELDVFTGNVDRQWLNIVEDMTNMTKLAMNAVAILFPTSHSHFMRLREVMPPEESTPIAPRTNLAQ